MLDMCSRSCSVLVIPILRGIEFSSRLDLYFLLCSISNLFHLSLYLSVCPLSHKTVVGQMKKRLQMNSVGGKRDSRIYKDLFLILFMVGIFSSIAIQYIYRVLLQLSILVSLLVAESTISIKESTYICMRL